MKYVLFYVVGLSLCFLSLSAQITKADYYNKIDNKVFTFSKQKPDAPFDTITTFVNTNFQIQEDRARAYYTWIALNIEFDEDYRGGSGFSLINDIRNINIIDQREYNTFHDKKSAGEGIADLMCKFCSTAKIPCYAVPGYVRRPDKTISNMSFVWNVLKLDSIWVHVDASMHYGYLNENYKLIRYPMKDYFCSKPSDFLKDHFPHDPMWQLLRYPCDKQEFISEIYREDNKQIYNYEDSLNIYMKKTLKQSKEVDVVRYFKYETNRDLYDRNMELYNYDKAADKMELGIDFFDKYADIGKNKLSKYPLKSDWKIAKEYLDKSELYFNETEKLLNVYILKGTETNQAYNRMYSSLKNNLSDVYKNQEYLEKLKPFLKEK